MKNFFSFIGHIYVCTYNGIRLKSDTQSVILTYVSLLVMYFGTKWFGIFPSLFILLVFWLIAQFLYMFVPNLTFKIWKFNVTVPDMKSFFQNKVDFHKDMPLYRLPKENDMYVLYGAGSIGWLLTVIL